MKLTELSQKAWDAVVVGAGPSGALAARELAKRSLSVLLVDRSPFPRWKVCGSCLNRAALETLREVGLGNLIFQQKAQPLRELKLFSGTWKGSLPLASMISLSREAFDMALIREAIREGARFSPETLALSGEAQGNGRVVRLYQKEQEILIQSRVVLVADGINGQFLKDEAGFCKKVSSDSRIGVGMVTSQGPAFYSSGVIFMAWERSGYVGLVRLEDGRLNVAGALDPSLVRRHGGAALAVQGILRRNGLPLIEGIENLPWRGTPFLTRRRFRVASDRLFVLGDAASYTEPFTGEGIAWALACGAKVIPLAVQAARQWRPGLACEWQTLYEHLIEKRQRLSKIAAYFLRHPSFTAPLLGHLHQPLR